MLRLHETPTGVKRHTGEVLSLAYSAEGAYVLSSGWDGQLKLWETSSGTPISALTASNKPVSACTIHPNGKQWVAGSMEGLLSFWDSHTHQSQSQYVGHTRPISDIRFSPDGQVLATTSWDRSVTLRTPLRDHEVRNLVGHTDIVSGCRFFPDGHTLVTWSHDRTVRLWRVNGGAAVAPLGEHKDRVLTAAVSPDGQWIMSASRDGEVCLWEAASRTKVRSLRLSSEPRACFFLLDGETVLTVDAKGRVISFSLPQLEVQFQLSTHVTVQSADAAPTGMQLALGDQEGMVHFVTVEGLEEAPLLVTTSLGTRKSATRWQKLLGRTQSNKVYECKCPVCNHHFELLHQLPSEPSPCPQCGRSLKYNPHVQPEKAPSR